MSGGHPACAAGPPPETFCLVTVDGIRLAGFCWRPGSPAAPAAPGAAGEPERACADCGGGDSTAPAGPESTAGRAAPDAPAPGDGGRPARRPPDGRAAAARLPVVLVHGIGEHLGRHRVLAERLAAGGRLVVGADLRGHGRSQGPRGHVERFDDYLDDLDLVVAQACGKALAVCGGTGAAPPPVLFGHSLGALIVLRYAARRFAAAADDPRRAPGRNAGAGRAACHREVLPPAGLVLASIGLQVAVTVPRWKRLVGRMCERLVPTLPFRTGIDPEALSTDAGVAKAYREDPLAHGVVTPRWYAAYETARTTALVEAGAIRCPVLVLHGLADRIADADGSRRLAGALHQADVTLRLYPCARHELFNDPAAWEAFDHLEAWLQRLEGAVPGCEP